MPALRSRRENISPDGPAPRRGLYRQNPSYLARAVILFTGDELLQFLDIRREFANSFGRLLGCHGVFVDQAAEFFREALYRSTRCFDLFFRGKWSGKRSRRGQDKIERIWTRGLIPDDFRTRHSSSKYSKQPFTGMERKMMLPARAQSPCKKILIVEDEPDVIEMLKRQLDRAGSYHTITAPDGSSGIKKAREEAPALIVLDLMLPAMSGLEVCRVLKSDGMTRAIPIIMLTAKAEEVDRIVGLEFGADDYVTKPFSPRELVLRIGAILRRISAPSIEKKLAAAGIVIDTERHDVRVAGKQVDLTAVEFKLLCMLMQRRGRVQSRDRLLNEVWGYEAAIDTRTVDTHVRRLREKLGKRSDLIETVRGFGYRFREADR